MPALSCAVPKTTVPSTKVTVPLLGVVLLDGLVVTEAVNVTAWPNVTEAAEMLSAVDVETPTVTVVCTVLTLPATVVLCWTL
jgi:hypothetical protein